jgi:hypothetical protein
VLVAGTFALSSPSFMVEAAQAQPYYGMDKKYSSYEQDYEMTSYDKKIYKNSYDSDYGKDRDYDKSKKDSSSSVSIKKIKCNNINANLNSVDASFGVPPVDGDTNGAGDPGDPGDPVSAESIAANGMGGNGDRSFVDRENNFAFVCINNNNNTVVEAPAVEDECPKADEIESCFRQVLSDSLFPRFVEALESEAGITVEINGQEVTLRSFEDICFALEGLTFEQLTIAIGDIIAGAEIELTFPSLSGLIQCISTALDIDVLSQ